MEEKVAAGKEEVEKQQQATDAQIADVCIQLRRLSPDITINSSVRKAICTCWHNVPVALTRVKNAIALLSAQGQSALHLVGGLYKLGMATEEELRWIKKEFVLVWKSTAADVKSIPPFYDSAHDWQLEAVR